MMVFRNIFFLAVAAGVFVGVVTSLLQASFTAPLILAAETYETAAAQSHSHDADVAAHTHDGEAWAPADGLQRTAFTVLANVVTGVGFALLLVAASEFAGGVTGWRAGLFWGLAGFAAFTLAPGLGLPPELPAMPAADLAARQLWWTGAVIATAAGLALICLGKSPLMAVVGLALIIGPHLVGAPQPASFESPVPEGLHHRFVVAVTLTNLVFWTLLGATIGLLRPRLAAAIAPPRDSLA